MFGCGVCDEEEGARGGVDAEGLGGDFEDAPSADVLGVAPASAGEAGPASDAEVDVGVGSGVFGSALERDLVFRGEP